MLQHVSKYLTLAVFTAAASLAANAQQTVTTQIAFQSSIVEGIAANPLMNTIYVVSPSGYPDVNDTVAVIDGNTDQIIANISVPVGAYYPAVDLRTDKVYVASCNNFINPSPCFVTVIDGRTNTVLTTIPVTTVKNGFLAGISVAPIQSLVYVSDTVNGNVVVIDSVKDVVKQTISLNGAKPYGMALNPLNNMLYVTLSSSTLDIINGYTDKITQVSTGAGTSNENVAVNWFTGNVFVVNTQFGPSTTAVLSSTGKLIAQVPVGQAAYGIDLDLLSNLALVAAVNDGNTSEINGKTNKLSATIEGTSPFFVAVNSYTHKVYSAGGGMVTVSTE